MPSLKKLCLKVTRWLFTIKLLPILFFSSAVTRDNSYNCKAIHGWQFPMSKSTMTARNLAPQRCMQPTDIETFSFYNKHLNYSEMNRLQDSMLLCIDGPKTCRMLLSDIFLSSLQTTEAYKTWETATFTAQQSPLNISGKKFTVSS